MTVNYTIKSVLRILVAGWRLKEHKKGGEIDSDKTMVKSPLET